MKNIWLIRNALRKKFPIGRRVKVIGPFNVLDEMFYEKYIGEYGTVFAYMYMPMYNMGYIGIILDINSNNVGNNLNWFTVLEIKSQGFD